MKWNPYFALSRYVSDFFSSFLRIWKKKIGKHTIYLLALQKLLMPGKTCRKTGTQGKSLEASKCHLHFWNLKIPRFLKFCMFKIINFEVFQAYKAKNLGLNFFNFLRKMDNFDQQFLQNFNFLSFQSWFKSTTPDYIYILLKVSKFPFQVGPTSKIRKIQGGPGYRFDIFC